jgi:hypothetical protein
MCRIKKQKKTVSLNQAVTWAVLLSIGNTRPGSKNVFRKIFSFAGFEERGLAESFAQRLGEFVQEFILAQAHKQAASGHFWIVQPLQVVRRAIPCELETEARSRAQKATLVPVTPTNTFNEIISKVLQAFTDL